MGETERTCSDDGLWSSWWYLQGILQVCSFETCKGIMKKSGFCMQYRMHVIMLWKFRLGSVVKKAKLFSISIDEVQMNKTYFR